MENLKVKTLKYVNGYYVRLFLFRFYCIHTYSIHTASEIERENEITIYVNSTSNAPLISRYCSKPL